MTSLVSFASVAVLATTLKLLVAAIGEVPFLAYHGPGSFWVLPYSQSTLSVVSFHSSNVRVSSLVLVFRLLSSTSVFYCWVLGFQFCLPLLGSRLRLLASVAGLLLGSRLLLLASAVGLSVSTSVFSCWAPAVLPVSTSGFSYWSLGFHFLIQLLCSRLPLPTSASVFWFLLVSSAAGLPTSSSGF